MNLISAAAEVLLVCCNFLINTSQRGKDLNTILYQDEFKCLSHQIEAVKVWTNSKKIPQGCDCTAVAQNKSEL